LTNDGLIRQGIYRAIYCERVTRFCESLFLLFGTTIAFEAAEMNWS